MPPSGDQLLRVPFLRKADPPGGIPGRNPVISGHNRKPSPLTAVPASSLELRISNSHSMDPHARFQVSKFLCGTPLRSRVHQWPLDKGPAASSDVAPSAESWSLPNILRHPTQYIAT